MGGMQAMAGLYNWQKEFLTRMTQFKGRGALQITGRNTGKSHWTNQAIKRLMEDIASRPVEAIICDVGTVYGCRYYTVEPIGGNWIDMETWCLDSFGSSSTSPIWGESKVPDVNERWYTNNRKFWFRDEKDRDWFLIRWNA